MNIQPRITIRVSKGSLAFAMADSRTEAKVAFEPYTAKSGVSMAANLRDAFKTANLLQVPTHRALVLIDAPTLLIPIEEFQEANAETLYTHCYPNTEGAVIMSNVLPEMNAVALFAVNKDLKMVVEDHYQEAKFSALMRPVWSYLHHRHFIGNRRSYSRISMMGEWRCLALSATALSSPTASMPSIPRMWFTSSFSCGSNWRSTNRKTSYTYRDRSDRRMSCSMLCASTWRR